MRNREIAYLESVVSPAEDFDRSFGSWIFFREDIVTWAW